MCSAQIPYDPPKQHSDWSERVNKTHIFHNAILVLSHAIQSALVVISIVLTVLLPFPVSSLRIANSPHSFVWSSILPLLCPLRSIPNRNKPHTEYDSDEKRKILGLPSWPDSLTLRLQRMNEWIMSLIWRGFPMIWCLLELSSDILGNKFDTHVHPRK